MKRKRTFSTDQVDENDEIPLKKKKSLKRLIGINVFIFSILVIPLLAISRMDHNNVIQGLDKILGERCNSIYWKPKNITRLKQAFDDFIFGQHVGMSVILSALKRRWTLSEIQYDKPLVMSFHGWTGSGKNYVAKFIAESLFRRGMKSSFVKIFISTIHFHDELKVQEYQNQLREWILSNVTRCPDTLFIFDEVDKMPVGVLDVLKPFMDHHSIINGVDMSKAIFILLSNTGGREITQRTFDFWQQGKARADLRLADFEPLIVKGAFNELGGLQKSLIIDKSLIDVYVPFLPLEQVHVKQCTERELKNRGYDPDTMNEMILQVLQDLSFWPEDSQLYSSTGCKRVAQKVDELLYEHEMSL